LRLRHVHLLAGRPVRAWRGRGARASRHAGGLGQPRAPPLTMRVPVGVKLSAFALVIMGSYTYFANSIPQIESKPPAELSLEGGDVSPAQLVKFGEEIFHTKGTCEICHKIGEKGTRAPDLAGVGAPRRPSSRSPATRRRARPCSRARRSASPATPSTRSPPGRSGRTSPRSRRSRRPSTSWPRF